MKQNTAGLGFLNRLALLLILFTLLNFFLSPSARAQGLSDYAQISYTLTGLNPTPPWTQVSIDVPFSISISGQVKITKDLGTPFNLVAEARITGRIVAKPASGPGITLNDSYTVSISPFPNKKDSIYNINQSVSLKFPGGSTPGDYQIVGELIEVRAFALGISINVLEWYPTLFPTTQTAGSVTLLAPSPPPGGGGTVVAGGGGAPPGGGGGSPAVTEVPPPTVLNATVLGKTREWPVNADGSLKQETKIRSEDGRIAINIREGTLPLDKTGKKLETVTVLEETKPPQPPPLSHIIGKAYNLAPDGATFKPELELVLAYDNKALPENAAEKDLSIAYWDDGNKKWMLLESLVDTKEKFVIAKVSHFTLFAIIGKVVLPPPLISTANLSISSTQVRPGEKTVISIDVSNKGGSEGKYSLALTINGVQVESREGALSAGASQKVSFTFAPDKPGAYTINLGGLTGSFSVVENPEIILSNLAISPNEVMPGERITVSTDVSNKGGSEGKYTLALIISGMLVESREATLAAGASQKVSFNVVADKPGTHTVSLGSLSGSFSVVGNPEFVLSNLIISPNEVKPGERITVSTEVTNKGSSEGKYALSLVIDGVPVETAEISLAAGAAQKVSFNTTSNNPGSHTVNLGGLSGSFSVRVLAEFLLSELVISPTEVKLGETITISADITNTGGSEGRHSLSLSIDGVTVETREITLAAGAAQKVSFNTTPGKPGTHAVNLGELSGSFLVKKGGIDTWLIVVIILFVIFAGDAVYIWWRMRAKYQA